MYLKVGVFVKLGNIFFYFLTLFLPTIVVVGLHQGESETEMSELLDDVNDPLVFLTQLVVLLILLAPGGHLTLPLPSF
jgi:hypothetical protein